MLTMIPSSRVLPKLFAAPTNQHITNSSNKRHPSCTMKGCDTSFASRKAHMLHGCSNSTYRSNSTKVAARYGQSFGRRIFTWDVCSVVLHVNLGAAVLVVSRGSSQSEVASGEHLGISLAASVCLLFCEIPWLQDFCVMVIFALNRTSDLHAADSEFHVK